MPKQVKKVAQKDFDDLSDYAQGDYELDSEEEKAREKRIQKRIDLARQRKEKFDQEYPPLTPEKQKELDELDPWKNSKELFNGRRVAQKSEQDVAKSMKEKGYNYIVQIQDSDAEPLYTKTTQQTSELLRTDLKNNRTNVMKIDEFLSKKSSSKMIRRNTRKYPIKKTNGQFWTGEMWGVRQAAEEYDLDDLPREIDGLESEGTGVDTVWVDPDDPEITVASVATSVRDRIYGDTTSLFEDKLEGALKKLGDESATKQEQNIAPQSRQIPLKLRGKSEQDVAKGMKEKGYNYILVFLDSDIEPLYTKTIEQASKLMREDYKNEHFDITTIDKFLSKKSSKKVAQKIQDIKEETKEPKSEFYAASPNFGDVVDAVQKESPNASEEEINYEAQDLMGIYWTDFVDNLDSVIQEMIPDCYMDSVFNVSASNLGWRKTSGEALYKFESGEDLLKIMPNTDYSMEVFKESSAGLTGIRLVVSHHDAPTGEGYKVYPWKPTDKELYEMAYPEIVSHLEYFKEEPSDAAVSAVFNIMKVDPDPDNLFDYELNPSNQVSLSFRSRTIADAVGEYQSDKEFEETPGDIPPVKTSKLEGALKKLGDAADSNSESRGFSVGFSISYEDEDASYMEQPQPGDIFDVKTKMEELFGIPVEVYSEGGEFANWVSQEELQRIADVISKNDASINDGILLLVPGCNVDNFIATRGHFGRPSSVVPYADWDDEFGISGVRDRNRVQQKSDEKKPTAKKQAAKMPGLFNSDYKKWLQMEAKILAMNAGAPSSQEEAELLMDKSIDKLVDMVADSVENEIYDVVDEVREDIIEEMIKKMQAQEVPVEALPEIEEPEAEISEPAVQAKPIAIPGGKKVKSLDNVIKKLNFTGAPKITKPEKDVSSEYQSRAEDLVEKSGNQPNFAYSGDKELGETWAGTVSRTRDSGIHEISNFEIIQKDMKSRFPKDVDSERFGHWAVGHVDTLMVRMLDKRGKVTPAGVAILQWLDKLEDYPLADEDDYHNRVQETISEQMVDAVKWHLPNLKDGVSAEDAAHAIEMWFDENNIVLELDTDDSSLVVSEEDVMKAATALGLLETEN